MELNKDLLLRIREKTTCEWTRGYISCVLDVTAPNRYELAREIIECELSNKRKIQAIKRIREVFGLGLKEAKGVVDEFERSSQIVFPGENSDDGLAGAAV